MRKGYSTDLKDEEWEIIEPLVPPALPGGRPRTHDMREILNAQFYVLRAGCAWRMLPHDFPPWSTVYQTFPRIYADIRPELPDGSGFHATFFSPQRLVGLERGFERRA